MDGSEPLEMRNTSIKCEKCRDVGGWFTQEFLDELQNEYQYWISCDCSVGNETNKLFKASRISEEFQKKSFDNFNLADRPQAVRDAQYCAKAYLEAFKGIQQQRRNSIAICGRPGSGKTHLLMAVSNGIIQQGTQVMYFPWVEALNNLKDDFSQLDKRIREMQEVDVLYIDDVFKGRREPTDWQLEQLFAVVNTRYLNKKPLLISSEKTIDQMISMDEGLGSRIKEMCHDYTVFMVGGQELNYRLREDTA